MSTYIIEWAGALESTLAHCGQEVKKYQYSSVAHATREIGLVGLCRETVCTYACNEEIFVYRDEETRDRDQTGELALAVIVKS